MEISGNCKFCGQGILLNVDEGIDQKQADEIACNKCYCYGALKDRELKNANEKLDLLFGDGCDTYGFEKLPEDQFNILAEAVKQRVYENYLSISFSFGSGIKAKVSRNAKGEIEINRTQTNTYKLTTKN